MKNPKLAEKLLQKAEQDLHAFTKWRHDTEIAEEILGFHAQQAAEKMLKAVLAYHAIDFPFTHRLSDLIDLGAEHGIVLPVQLEEVRFLTPLPSNSATIFTKMTNRWIVSRYSHYSPNCSNGQPSTSLKLNPCSRLTEFPCKPC